MNIIHYSVSNNIISQKMAITYAKKMWLLHLPL